MGIRDTLTPEEARELAAAAFGDGPDPAVADAACALTRCTEAEALTLLAVVPPDRPALVPGLVGQRWPPPLAASLRRWEQYTERVRAEAEDEPATRQRAFGACVRCGSHRLLVTTRQLRRADEGATELRSCRDCGHTSRINS